MLNLNNSVIGSLLEKHQITGLKSRLQILE